MSMLKNGTSLYKDMSMDTLSLVQRLNQQRESTFLIPTRFISSENAQLAYLLNEYYNFGRDESQKKLYRSFYVNTRYEALQGAIKLIRHNGLLKKRNMVLVLDPEHDFFFIANPLNEEKEEDYLIPGLTFVRTIEELISRINQSSPIAGVILSNSEQVQHSDYSEVIKLCKEKEIITLLNDPDHIPGQEFLLHKLSNLTDMVILGEPLTDYEVPFSLFSMSAEVHKPWTSVQTCLFHSSTYSGNKLAVSKAKNSLFDKVSFFFEGSESNEICSNINSNIEETIRYFENYVNPGLVKFYSIVGYDFVCKGSNNSWLDIENSHGENKHVLDAVSGGGAAVRGHCRDDIYTDVLSNHSQSEDYWERLADRLRTLFSFPHVFPAVSGATAVEIALILSLLASKDKKRIIVFKDNFAGNTLVSLIGTANNIFHKFFQPIYKYVTYVNPFDSNAEEVLKSELEKGNVGLIWLEILQGGTERQIPDNILKVIQDYKEKFGYYIGVDEILMGFYRIDKLSSYQDTVIKPDLITFSKVLADGTYPMAATLISEDVYKNAREKNSNIVSTFENLYKNQFGAHIGLNSIDKLTDPLTVEKIKRTSKILSEGLEQLKKCSPYIKDIYGKGHMYRLLYKNTLMNIYFCKRALQKENLFIYIDRLVPSVTISEEDAKELIERLKRLYSGVGNPIVFKLKSIFISFGILKKMLS
ncbi:MAG TPA: aminotransferase class III-fold pyridoxal phosphate-dependent enzyme [Clostridia bacterium]